jgi:hypothetical protein
VPGKRGHGWRAGVAALSSSRSAPGSLGGSYPLGKEGRTAVTSIRLEIATGQYDSTRALFDGSVGIEGAEVTMRTGRTLPEIFERMMRHREFDVCELGWTF